MEISLKRLNFCTCRCRSACWRDKHPAIALGPNQHGSNVDAAGTASAGLQAIDSVTRVSSRVEFIESEFNGANARSPYIEHQVSASDAASR
jgi:hypothetical protein